MQSLLDMHKLIHGHNQVNNVEAKTDLYPSLEVVAIIFKPAEHQPNG